MRISKTIYSRGLNLLCNFKGIQILHSYGKCRLSHVVIGIQEQWSCWSIFVVNNKVVIYSEKKLVFSITVSISATVLFGNYAFICHICYSSSAKLPLIVTFGINFFSLEIKTACFISLLHLQQLVTIYMASRVMPQSCPYDQFGI